MEVLEFTDVNRNLFAYPPLTLAWMTAHIVHQRHLRRCAI